VIRLIVKSSGQVSENEWSVFYETFLVDHPKLENLLRHTTAHVVGAEIEPPKESEK
jgi:hypothetical protein